MLVVEYNTGSGQGYWVERIPQSWGRDKMFVGEVTANQLEL